MSSPPELTRLELGDEIPNFQLPSQVGQIDFHAYLEGKWGAIVTIRDAFDPVTTTEVPFKCSLQVRLI